MNAYLAAKKPDEVNLFPPDMDRKMLPFCLRSLILNTLNFSFDPFLFTFVVILRLSNFF